jgi:hypothetical protein
MLLSMDDSIVGQLIGMYLIYYESHEIYCCVFSHFFVHIVIPISISKEQDFIIVIVKLGWEKMEFVDLDLFFYR